MKTNLPAPPATRTDLVLARAREVLARTPRPEPERIARPVMVHVPVTCTRSGITYLAAGVRRDETFMMQSAAPMPKARGECGSGPASTGYFVGIEFADDFVCPGCRRAAPAAVWVCDCAPWRGTLHACGDEARAGYCACGRLETRYFGDACGAELRVAEVARRATLASTTRGAGQVSAPAGRLLLPGKRG